MINYYCPDFFMGIKTYLHLCEMKQVVPTVFYDDVNIKAVFGSFPNMTWNGGGTFFGPMLADVNEIRNVFSVYKKLNIKLQLTMTNALLEKEDCYDRYGNTVLRIISEEYSDDFEILVSSPILEEYIREKYPSLKISRSIIAAKDDCDYSEALKKYENVVMPIRHLENFELLNSFSPEEKRHIELLCNDPCPRDCPRLYTHYPEYAKATLLMETLNPSLNPALNCNNHVPLSEKSLSANSRVTYDEIKEVYVPMGFSEFKLSGRGNVVNIITSIVPYFIKPEYQVGAIKHLLMNNQ
ncbi:hypothetical protein M2140_000123 [Clostridiales Family XIII bacterium PM5-7]